MATTAGAGAGTSAGLPASGSTAGATATASGTASAVSGGTGDEPLPLAPLTTASSAGAGEAASRLTAALTLKLMAHILTAECGVSRVTPAPSTAVVTASPSALLALQTLSDAHVSFDHLQFLSEREWTAFCVTEDITCVVRGLLALPTSPVSATWSRYAFLLRDRGIARPDTAGDCVKALAAFHDALKPPTTPVPVCRFVNRVVLTALCDVADAPANARQASLRRAVVLQLQPLLVSH